MVGFICGIYEQTMKRDDKKTHTCKKVNNLAIKVDVYGDDKTIGKKYLDALEKKFEKK